MPLECPMRADILRHWTKSLRLLERDVARVIPHAHVFNVQNIVDYVNKIVKEKGTFDIPKYERVALPFPVCHFEYRFPSYWLTNKRSDTGIYDASVTMCKTQGQETVSINCALRGIVDKIPGHIATVELPYDGLDLSKEVTIAVGAGTMGERMGRIYVGPKDKSPADVLGDVTARMIMPCLYALNLLACKNIQRFIEERDTLQFHKENGGKKKEWVPTFTYKVVNIPYIHDVITGKYDRYLSEHKNLPLHDVMGHFKTYTAERPLMGKHVGTYWWANQLRGLEENGIIVKDHRFGEIPDTK